MSERFLVGDSVIFELSLHSGKLTPRWDMDRDYGGCGLWADGKVAQIDHEEIWVSYDLSEHGYVGTGSVIFPNKKNERYDPYQWYRDGYLKLSKRRASCECGSEKVYRGNAPHSHWCPKYVEFIGERSL